MPSKPPSKRNPETPFDPDDIARQAREEGAREGEERGRAAAKLAVEIIERTHTPPGGLPITPAPAPRTSTPTERSITGETKIPVKLLGALLAALVGAAASFVTMSFARGQDAGVAKERIDQLSKAVDSQGAESKETDKRVRILEVEAGKNNEAHQRLEQKIDTVTAQQAGLKAGQDAMNRKIDQVIEELRKK